MKLLISSFIIAGLYGIYDFFIKLSAGKITPIFGAFICQLFSLMTILLVIFYQKFILKSFQLKSNTQGIIFVTIAGILIGMALIGLFLLFQNKQIKVSTTLPAILTIRNLTVILLGIFILKEKLTLLKAIGILLSQIGIYFILS